MQTAALRMLAGVAGPFYIGGLVARLALLRREVASTAASSFLMERASPVVDHGGHGTTVRALRRGLPMVGIPAKGADQIEDGIPHSQAVGGVRISHVATPPPAPGATAKRWQRLPLAEYPHERVKYLYFTRRAQRAMRCGVPARSITDDK